jgi:hypothetical protein
MNSLAPHILPPSNLKSTGRKKVLWWYDAIIDLMLAYPNMTKKDIAEKLGKGYSTICIVTSSDVFRHRLAMRRQEHSRALSEDLVHNTMRVANKALGMTMERLESGDGAKIPALSLFSIAEKAMERLGYGVKAGVNVNIDNRQQTISAPADAVASAQAAIRAQEVEALRTREAPVAQRVEEPSFPSEVPPTLLDLEAVEE